MNSSRSNGSRWKSTGGFITVNVSGAHWQFRYTRVRALKNGFAYAFNLGFGLVF